MTSYWNRLDSLLQEDNFATRTLGFIETKTKVGKKVQCVILIVLAAIYLLVGYAAALLCNFIGVVYPAYCSCKALETENKDDDVQWLTYWVVFAVFTFLEFFSDILLSWMPFYFLLKCAFLVWCMLPIASNGSMTIYRGIIRPYFLKYEKQLDKAVDQAGKAAKDLQSKAKDLAGNAAAAAVMESVKQSSGLSSDKPDKQD
jgi:receptor expression-enhancing protein 5/6